MRGPAAECAGTPFPQHRTRFRGAQDNGEVRVQPFVDWSRMEFLRLIDYELSGLIAPVTGPHGDGEGKGETPR